MRHFFLDTNIIIDFLADRKPFSESAAALFQYSLDSRLKLYVASVSFNNVYYIVRQQHSHEKTISLLNELEKWVTIISVDASVIRQALHSSFKDFEDAIQSYAADSIAEIECLITRNSKDFKNSRLPVFSSDTAVGFLRF